MKKFILSLIVLVSLFAAGCGGGGSSSVGPEIKYPDNTKLADDYPAVNTNYASVKDVMSSPTSTEAERTELTNDLLMYFSDDFKDKDGNDAKEKIQATTLDYLEQYSLSSYKFSPIIKDEVGHNYNETTGILTVRTLIQAVANSGSMTINVDKVFDIEWKLSNGNWVIVGGFPTTKAELGL
ncbi:MAG: hypothetical protein PHF29_09630 [Candidatus Riflebacteria bacterium]|nr:hypothetical protein [Candidatus Riflebacteria bacterium]MDD3002001.1 hypothetical protein [Candidatus Riflebacteria bacterium]